MNRVIKGTVTTLFCCVLAACKDDGASTRTAPSPAGSGKPEAAAPRTAQPPPNESQPKVPVGDELPGQQQPAKQPVADQPPQTAVARQLPMPDENALMRELPMDPHSHSRPNEVRVRHARFDLVLDFAKKQITGTATLELKRFDKDRPLILDTQQMTIDAVTGQDGKSRPYALGKATDLLGQSLTIQLAEDDTEVTVRYATSPDARALQWLDKVQTYGNKKPYLYTQGQAILTRSWLPLQDTPGVRMTYTATIKAPPDLRVVMSANVREKKGAGQFAFAMDKPIPCYLIALACGDIAFGEISERVGVFADPKQLPEAIHEFADTEKMLAQCAARFGPYGWGRFDILVLPPAFPFGGMENPTLTFATPTIIVGDKSLVALIAHEMAHSWSGNLVTNATWRDFWLNEGFTVYLEQRIMELVYGRDRAEMEIAIGMMGLRRELAELPPQDQILHIDLTGRNPDDAMTAIAYDKGAAFLRRLEQVFGRAAFDSFLTAYFKAHAFQSITTEQFLAYLDEHLLRPQPEKAKSVDVKKWVFEPGLPATAPAVTPKAFLAVDRVRARVFAGPDVPADITTGSWTTHEWLHFIDGMPAGVSEDKLRKLDQRFGLASHPNPEIRCAFLVYALKNKAYEFVPQATDFAQGVGRRKFLVPIFKALGQEEPGRNHAVQIFVAIADRLHSITRETLQKILDG